MVVQASGPAAATTATASSAESQTAASALSSDFETFLSMLTAQISNQDPLNPMESSDFAVQLATFSGVEQQVRSNELLEGLSGQLNQIGLAQLAGWVGMDAQVKGNAWFDGNPVELTLTPATGADRAVLVVKNGQGNEVDRTAVDPGGGTMDWAGVGSDGSPLPSGLYGFTLESYRGDEKLAAATVPVFSTITEARNENGTVMLVLEGGVTVPADEITALRS